MLKTSAKTLSLAAALALTTMGAWAQASSTPTTVGTTPQEARQATRNAVPQADTATLVRTGPSATQRAGDATHMAQVNPSPSGNSPAPQVSNSQGAMGNNAGTTGNTGTAGTSGATGSTGASSGAMSGNNSDTGMTGTQRDNMGARSTSQRTRNRAARADRN